jgi:hypothetical protein
VTGGREGIQVRLKICESGAEGRNSEKGEKTKTKMFTAGKDHDNVCTLLRLARPRFLLGVPGWDIFLITLNDKSVSVREDMRFEFRAEAFNVFNHASFSNPNPLFAPHARSGRVWSDFVNDW